MTPEILLSIGGILATGLVGILAWSLKRNIGKIDDDLKVVATDVRQLAAQGARHGESLAAGVQQFKAIEKRLDKLEAWKEKTLEETEP